MAGFFSTPNIPTILELLPIDKQVKFKSEISSVINKYFFQEIELKIKDGLQYERMDTLDPMKSLLAFHQATQLSNALLELVEGAPLSRVEKSKLSEVYARYASVMRKFKPEEIDTRKEMVQKALSLNPENETALRIKSDISFYDADNVRRTSQP